MIKRWLMQVIRFAIAHDLKLIHERYNQIGIKIDECLEEIKEWDRETKADFEESYRRLGQLANDLKELIAISTPKYQERPSYYPPLQVNDDIPNNKSRTSRKRAE